MSSSLLPQQSYRPPNVPARYYENQKYGFVGIQIALVLYGKRPSRPPSRFSHPSAFLLTANAGIATVLFVQSFFAHLRMLRKPGVDNQRSKKIQLVYICAIFICATILMVAEGYVNGVAALEYPLYPGGSYAWSLANYNDPIFMLTQVPFAVTTWLADGFMVSRAGSVRGKNHLRCNLHTALSVLRRVHGDHWNVVHLCPPTSPLHCMHWCVYF
jgi:hypothetical protein